MYQKVIIIGNLGQNPELKETPSGQHVCNFAVATSRKWTDNSGERLEETIWFRVSIWGKQALSCANSLKKNSRVYCEGKLNQISLDHNRNNYEMTAYEVKFLDKKNEELENG